MGESGESGLVFKRSLTWMRGGILPWRERALLMVLAVVLAPLSSYANPRPVGQEIPGFRPESVLPRETAQTCGLSPTTRAQRITYLEAREQNLRRSILQTTREITTLREALSDMDFAHAIGSTVFAASLLTASTVYIPASAAILGTYARIGYTLGTLAFAPASSATGFFYARQLRRTVEPSNEGYQSHPFFMEALEQPPVRRFMMSNVCDPANCYPAHAEFLGGYQWIQMAYQRAQAEFTRQNERWWRLELFSRNYARRIAQVDLPHAILIREYLTLEHEHYARLRTILEAGRAMCGR